ncbi:hypothetical protein GCM10010446_51910 [Streptomyces enissocaesilis]|uniref:Uncharacterized protein n=1 Tax=Streptomyces enissocaesilis TaxID=332589 RepID=A0ABN3XLT0_9ACTN
MSMSAASPRGFTATVRSRSAAQASSCGTEPLVRRREVPRRGGEGQLRQRPGGVTGEAVYLSGLVVAGEDHGGGFGGSPRIPGEAHRHHTGVTPPNRPLRPPPRPAIRKARQAPRGVRCMPADAGVVSLNPHFSCLNPHVS